MTTADSVEAHSYLRGIDLEDWVEPCEPVAKPKGKKFNRAWNDAHRSKRDRRS